MISFEKQKDGLILPAKTDKTTVFGLSFETLVVLWFVAMIVLVLVSYK